MAQSRPVAPLDPVVRHLYIHVPFCPSICPYCDFHVVTRQAGVVERYLQRLEQEAQALAERYPVDLDTVYLGGGTPSFLRDAELRALVESVQRHLGWGREENTLEINPGTVSPDRAALWRGLGIDRASVGLQSLHDPTLKFLGRTHNARQARNAVDWLRQQDLRVSGDLITAVPGQPLEEDVRALMDLDIGHLSAYTLTIEPGTEFARRGVQVDEDAEQAGFFEVGQWLEAGGFSRYEVSNYARPGQESRHNLAYWQGRTYLGLGPSAAGHYPTTEPGLLRVRRTNPRLAEWLVGGAGADQPIDAQEYVTDALFMGLRLRQGVNLTMLSQHSGLDLWSLYQEAIQKNVAVALLERQGEWLRATPQGWWWLNRVLRDFLSDED